jgi:hypothetical protein
MRSESEIREVVHWMTFLTSDAETLAAKLVKMHRDILFWVLGEPSGMDAIVNDLVESAKKLNGRVDAEKKP